MVNMILKKHVKKPTPTNGSLRTIVKLAIFPKKMSNGDWIIGKYAATQMYLENVWGFSVNVVNLLYALPDTSI